MNAKTYISVSICVLAVLLAAALGWRQGQFDARAEHAAEMEALKVEHEAALEAAAQVSGDEIAAVPMGAGVLDPKKDSMVFLLDGYECWRYLRSVSASGYERLQFFPVDCVTGEFPKKEQAP